MRSRRISLLAAGALFAAGCAGMPTGGSVHVGRALPAAGGLGDLDVRVLPPSWQSTLAPHDVVTGFLRALVNDDDDYAIARSFLTNGASAGWRPDDVVTTYEDDGLRTTQTATTPASRVVAVAGPRVGRIDARGDYSAAPGTLRATFVVARQSSGWRISRLPNGVLLSALDVPRFFRSADVYYLNARGTRLAPEQVLLQNSARGIATALVGKLLAGPVAGLASAVHSAAPPGTTLVGNVPVDASGVADVNVSSALRLASRTALEAFSAQLVWTLRQVSGVTAVRLLIDGAPVTVPKVGLRAPIDAWPTFDPAPAPRNHSLLWIDEGRLRSTADIRSLARSDPGSVAAVGRSYDGSTLAVVQAGAGRQRLLTGPAGGRLTERLAATSITAPTFDSVGDVFAVVTDSGRQRVVAVTASGTVRVVPADDGVLRPPVSALRIAPDGVHVAAVVGSGQLFVGLVQPAGGGWRLGRFHLVNQTLRGVSGVSWSAPDTLIVAVEGVGSTRQLLETDTDGYTLRPVSTDGVRGTPIAVCAAPSLPLVLATADGVVWSESGGWHKVGAGGQPVYSG